MELLFLLLAYCSAACAALWAFFWCRFQSRHMLAGVAEAGTQGAGPKCTLEHDCFASVNIFYFCWAAPTCVAAILHNFDTCTAWWEALEG
jgi:hypothetical protein